MNRRTDEQTNRRTDEQTNRVYKQAADKSKRGSQAVDTTDESVVEKSGKQSNE
jgi:hypothetical protein